MPRPPMDSGAQHRGRRPAPASYYAVLGVAPHVSVAEIRAAYRKLAMKWHPDRCRGERVDDANRRFQQIQEAYEVLSDERRRGMYDAGFYKPLQSCGNDGDVKDVEGFWDFVEEMVKLMAEVKSEKECSMEELQRMLAEMDDAYPVPPTPPCAVGRFDDAGRGEEL